MSNINVIDHWESINQKKDLWDYWVYSDELLNILSNDQFSLNTLWNILVERHSTDISSLSWEEQFLFLKDRALYILPEKDLLDKLIIAKEKWETLSIKFGIDPTWAHVHLWHAVPMIMLNRLQRMGHKINLIIGDFTAKIGDPTWRSTERPSLTDEQIQENLSTYQEQVAPFFDMSKAKVYYNGEWLKNLTLNELIQTLSNVNVSKVLQREDFRKRLDNNQWLALSEMIYPVVMWMDSVALKNKGWCDIELGGKDQFLNMQMCRLLMENHWQEPEAIISTDILEWISWWWLKMSKSLNNYIALNDSSEEIFGKIMSIPDSLLELYYKSLTDISNQEWIKIDEAMKSWKINPRDIKKTLAKILISIIYNKNLASEAELWFEKKFSQKKNYWELDLPVLNINKSIEIVNLISDSLYTSKSETRRLVDWWAVTLFLEDNSTMKFDITSIQDPIWKYLNNQIWILKIGKKRFLKIRCFS